MQRLMIHVQHATLVSGDAGQIILTALFTDRANIVRGAEIHLNPRADRQHFFRHGK